MTARWWHGGIPGLITGHVVDVLLAWFREHGLETDFGPDAELAS